MKSLIALPILMISALSAAETQPSQQAIENFNQAREYHTNRYYQATSLVRFDGGNSWTSHCFKN